MPLGFNDSYWDKLARSQVLHFLLQLISVGELRMVTLRSEPARRTLVHFSTLVWTMARQPHSSFSGGTKAYARGSDYCFCSPLLSENPSQDLVAYSNNSHSFVVRDFKRSQLGCML